MVRVVFPAGAALLLAAAALHAEPAGGDAALAAVSHCARIAAPSQRLACFDGVAATLARPAAAPAVAAPPAPAPAVVASAPPPPDRPVPVATPAAPLGLRLALGYGWGIGDHAGGFKLLGGRIDLDSAAGSAGGLGVAQVWVDHWPFDDWAIGGEYLFISRTDRARLTFPHGISILTDPVTGNAGARLSGDLGVLNLAWRPLPGGWVHPSVGAGLAVGWGQVSAHYMLTNAFVGTFTNAARAASVVAGVQGFVSIDFDLFDGIYASLVPRAIWLTGHPVGVDQQYLDFSVSGLIGFRF